jgi:hypothetical protein
VQWEPGPVHERALWNLFVVIMDGFPETDPDIENTEAAANSADEGAAEDRPNGGVQGEEAIVCPLRAPREDDEEYSDDGA